MVKWTRLTFRLVWTVCIGSWLGMIYLIPALLMSPFWTLYGGGNGGIIKKWWVITTLKPTRKSDWR